MSEPAGDNEHSNNATNCPDNMIRFKFSGEFHDRSQYSVDLCTDPKSIMTLIIYMSQLKKGLSDDPLVVSAIDSAFSALVSICIAIRSKLQPSVQLSGSIFGPFSPMGGGVSSASSGTFTAKDKDGNVKPGVNPNSNPAKDVFPPFTGIPDFKEIGDMLSKLSDITNQMFKDNKDKGYKSYSPADHIFDPKKIFEQDKAEADPDSETDHEDDNKKE
jgi:hypothetical protein